MNYIIHIEDIMHLHIAVVVHESRFKIKCHQRVKIKVSKYFFHLSHQNMYGLSPLKLYNNIQKVFAKMLKNYNLCEFINVNCSCQWSTKFGFFWYHLFFALFKVTKKKKNIKNLLSKKSGYRAIFQLKI